MDFPNDPKVANLGDQYMFGPAFMVAPVTDQGVTERDVYLPAGAGWYDFWTGKKYDGRPDDHGGRADRPDPGFRPRRLDRCRWARRSRTPVSPRRSTP
ncbi:hypothetical protein ACRAWD_30765 [Caulobacter segnis]